MTTLEVVRKRRWRFSPSVLAYGPLLAQIVVTRRCNLSCGYCNEYDEVSAPVPREHLERYIDHLANLGLLFCEFTGGETLLHPDIIELVRYASSYKFNERWIITNGYRLSRDVVEQLNDAGLTHLQISIDGVTPNDTTVKVLKPLRKKIEHLEKYAKFAVQINAVLGAGNDEEVLEVMKFARDAGFRPRASIIHDGNGGMILDERGKELLEEVSAIVGKRFKESGGLPCASRRNRPRRFQVSSWLALPLRRRIRHGALVLAATRRVHEAAPRVHVRRSPRAVPHEEGLRADVHGRLRSHGEPLGPVAPASQYLHSGTRRRAVCAESKEGDA